MSRNKIRQVKAKLIEDTVAALVVKANIVLRNDVFAKLSVAHKKERGRMAKRALSILLENANIAKSNKMPICQDTGFPVVFVELGQDVHIQGGEFKRAINRGVLLGYKTGFLRKSIVSDPINRKALGYTPAVIHTEVVKGSKVKISVLPKGFGCENKAKIAMFNPTAKLSAIKDFIVGVVREAGSNACPPYVVGVGIGGTQDYAALLAKKALLRSISKQSKLEMDLLNRINKLHIGPMGLGGKNTCLAVSIRSYPTHIAGLPVAVNISCHALRTATKII